MIINYMNIFRIAQDGIYYSDGKFCFSDVVPKGGFYGELNHDNGKFIIEFYTESEFVVEFNFHSFCEGQTGTSLCLGKAKSFCLFLETYGVIIKDRI